MFNVAATSAACRCRNAEGARGGPARAHRLLPDVPTMDEAGMPGFDAGIWIGLLAPADTPADVIDKLAARRTRRSRPRR